MKSKLLIYTLLTIAFAGSSCTTEDGPGPLPVGEGPFEVSVTDITFRNALIRVVPDDATMKYYSHILPKASFAKRNYDVGVFLAEYWQVVSESTGLSVPEIVEQSLVKGNDEWEYPYLEAGTDYVVFAVGLNADGTPSTKPAFAEFKSTAPGPLERVDCTFDIEVSNIQHTSADFTINPSDLDVPYFSVIIKAAEWDAAKDKQALMHDLFKNAIDETMDGLDQAYQETVVQLTIRGDFGGTLEPGRLRPGTEYVVLAYGIDKYERATTDPGVERFSTPGVDPSSNTFVITIQDTTAIDVTWHVETSNNDPYFTGIFPKELIGGLSDEVLVALLETGGQIGDYFSGSGDYDGMQMLFPETDYQIIAVGYSLAATTAVTRKEVRTLKGGSPATCSFTLNVVPAAMSATLGVTPSDETVFYFCELIPADKFTTDEAYQKSICDGLAKACQDMGATMQDALLNLCYRGYYESEYATKSLAKYYAVAFALNMDGTPAGKLYKKEFTAAEQIVSNAKAEVELVKYYNGGELKEYDPETYEYYVDLTGAPYAYVDCKVTHNEDAVTWYAGLFGSEIMDASDAAVIKNLVEHQGGEKNSETLTLNTAYFFDVEYNGMAGMKNAFIAVALDKDGNYGPIFRKEFSLTTDGASPISELVEATPAAMAFASGLPLRMTENTIEETSFAAKWTERPFKAMLPKVNMSAARESQAPIVGIRPAANGAESGTSKSAVSRSEYGSGRVR